MYTFLSKHYDSNYTSIYCAKTKNFVRANLVFNDTQDHYRKKRKTKMILWGTHCCYIIEIYNWTVSVIKRCLHNRESKTTLKNGGDELLNFDVCFIQY